MKGIGLFVSYSSSKKLLLSMGQAPSQAKTINSNFFGLTVEGAVELFLSKSPCVEDSILDLSFDNLRFLSLPSTLTPPLSTFMKRIESESSLASPMTKAKSDIIGFDILKLKPISDSPRASVRSDNRSLRRQDSNNRLLEIKLFTIVFVVDAFLAKAGQVEDYIQLLKQEIAAGIATEQEACQYLEKEILKLLDLRKEHEEKAFMDSAYISKAIAVSSLAREFSEMYARISAGEPFSLTINSRTTVRWCHVADLVDEITEHNTLLLWKERVSSICPPVNQTIVSAISPYKPLSSLFHSLGYEFTMQEIIETAEALVRGKVGKCINPISERQIYVVSPDYAWNEKDVDKFYEKFSVSLPEILAFFMQPKNGHELAEKVFFEEGPVSIVWFNVQ